MHVALLVLRMFQLFLWLLLNLCFKAIQILLWRVTGVSDALRRGAENSRSSSAAQVLKVRGRFKFCEYLVPASLWDFLVSHEKFEAPEYVLQDHITLYTITENEAIFVETQPGQKVWDSRKNPSFFMAAQFFNAKKIVRMSTESLHYLADQLGDPKGKLIFISNCARCGSTLLAQLFEATDRIVSFGEPNCLNFLSKIDDTGNKEKTKNEALERLTVSTIRLLCKPTKEGKELAYVIKLCSPVMSATPLLMRLFPSSKHFYLYREPLKVAQSLYRLSCSLYSLKFVYYFGRRSATRLGTCMSLVGFPSSMYRQHLNSYLAFGVLNWCVLLRKYLDFRAAGMNMVALRYEDIVDDTVESMKTIFRFCDLPDELAEQTVGALQCDSQKDTALATGVLKNFPVLSYENEAKVECDKLTERFGFPRIGEEFIAEFTITHVSHKTSYNIK